MPVANDSHLTLKEGIFILSSVEINIHTYIHYNIKRKETQFHIVDMLCYADIATYCPSKF